MDADRVVQRVLELHENVSMPLAEALALAINEAAPGPIWPCAKLVIRDGQVSLLSHQYAPGLPDGEHDVYPLPVDAEGVPVEPAEQGLLLKFSLAYMDGLMAGCDPEPARHWKRVREAASGVPGDSKTVDGKE